MPKRQSSHIDQSAFISRPRSVALVTTLWLFGLATSLFLIGNWGRTVAVDNATIEESARTIIDADIAENRINTWFEDALAATSGGDSETVRSVADAVESRPEYRHAVDTIITAFIDSLFAVEGELATVDLDAALDPLVPVVASEFTQRGVPIEEAQIDEILDETSLVALDTGEAASMAAVVDDARVFLSNVVVAALVAMLLTAALAMKLSVERLAMARQLASRVMLAALSYAVILRLASWALDPNRGRSPAAGGLAVLLKSNAQIFALAGVLAASIVVSGSILGWRRRKAEAQQAPGSVHDETEELSSV